MHEYPIFECNYRCACYNECKNRVRITTRILNPGSHRLAQVVQHGRKVPLNIVKAGGSTFSHVVRSRSLVVSQTPRKGWGVFADSKPIPAGTYIGTYAGELLTNEEGEERGR